MQARCQCAGQVLLAVPSQSLTDLALHPGSGGFNVFAGACGDSSKRCRGLAVSFQKQQVLDRALFNVAIEKLFDRHEPYFDGFFLRESPEFPVGASNNRNLCNVEEIGLLGSRIGEDRALASVGGEP